MIKIENCIDKIIQADCMDFLKEIPDNSVDLILTDPPYNLEIDQKKYTGVYGEKSKHLKDIKENFGNRFNPQEFLENAIHKSKNGLIIWFSKNLIPVYVNFAVENKLHWAMMHWIKRNPIPAHFNHLLNDTEYCIRIYKPGAYFNNELSYEDYKSYYLENVLHSDDHPTPKPLEIMLKQVKVFSKPGDLILDTYSGSGTTAIACIQTGRNFIGIEKKKAFCDSSRKRIFEELLKSEEICYTDDLELFQ